jgi:hypothetical protein
MTTMRTVAVARQPARDPDPGLPVTISFDLNWRPDHPFCANDSAASLDFADCAGGSYGLEEPGKVVFGDGHGVVRRVECPLSALVVHDPAPFRLQPTVNLRGIRQAFEGAGMGGQEEHKAMIESVVIREVVSLRVDGF